MSVVQLKTGRVKDQASQVEKLERYLRLAKEGKLESLAIAVIMDGSAQASFVGDYVSLLGSLTMAKYSLCQQMEEGEPI